MDLHIYKHNKLMSIAKRLMEQCEANKVDVVLMDSGPDDLRVQRKPQSGRVETTQRRS